MTDGQASHAGKPIRTKPPHLRAVAYRMLGSLSEAEDAVQEGWLRPSRFDISDVNNLGGWLTTVVARVCLDMLRSRKSRRGESLEEHTPDTIPDRTDRVDPEQEAQLGDSVGSALLVVLEMLPPAERLAFVVHDIFDLSFGEIAPIVDRSPTAARQLASRARRRVQGARTIHEANITRQREAVEAFLAAARGSNFEALLALLDPDVVLHSDPSAVPRGAPTKMHGAIGIANDAAKAAGARARPALVTEKSESL